MRIRDFIAGLEILKPYYGDNDYQLGAEHDIIYLYPTERPLTPEDVKRMRELGWFQEGHSEEPDYYSQDESWSAFT